MSNPEHSVGDQINRGFIAFFGGAALAGEASHLGVSELLTSSLEIVGVVAIYNGLRVARNRYNQNE